MLELTKTLFDLRMRGLLPFFAYKFYSSDADGVIRYDTQYRDRGASPIIYVANEKVELVNQVLEGLSIKHEGAFLPQDAPFKFPPHGHNNEGWHISMEASDLDTRLKTPDEGMNKATADFLTTLGLTKELIPIQSLNNGNLRNAWEKAVLNIHRNPKAPWIATGINKLIPPILLNI